MSRKTYSLSAIAIAATASLSFSSADGAVANAQDAGANAQAQTEVTEQAESLAEIVPQPTVFTSEEVVQPLAEEDETPATEASSLRELVGMVDTSGELTEQMRCLAGAIYFESRGEPLYGQLAVAETVINRSDDARWPASYCGVVLQRAQFSFVRNGRMPRVNTNSAAWTRAKAIARIAHNDMWESAAKDAVYFHADYVRPRWSRSKTRLTQIDTHIFYR